MFSTTARTVTCKLQTLPKSRLLSTKPPASSFKQQAKPVQSEKKGIDWKEASIARPQNPVLPQNVRRNNMGVAFGCVAFVVGVWYYSVAAVGGGKRTSITDELDELDRVRKINIHQSGEYSKD